MADLKTGDKVTWKSHGGTAHGTVEKKQTSPTRIKSHAVSATKDAPQYIVRSDNGGKAAHKRAALNKA
jgi:Hypervirulence associated proteins TUDOR domain